MKTAFPFTIRKTLFLCVYLFPLITAFGQPNYPRTPEDARIIHTDLLHFVEAYRELSQDQDTLKVLQTLYFDRGTAGLKEFVSRHSLTAELLKKAIGDHPERYDLLPNFLDSIGAVEAQYAQDMKEFNRVLPNAMYAPTYLLVGANRGIGQASPVGQLVTVIRVLDQPEKRRKLIVHELAHFQQAMSMGGQKYVALYGEPNNMLGICLREGGAEFITSLVLGEITQVKALEYIQADEARLKQKFSEDLATQNKDYWLWASIEQKEYPPLLGYAMGHKICKAFFEKAVDKDKAMSQLLQMPDAQAFVAESGYLSH